MKKMLFLFIGFLFVQSLSAQLRFGLKIGASTTSLGASGINILDEGGLDRLGLAIKDAKWGIHGGALLQIRLGNFLIQPEFLYNSTRVDFEVTDFGSSQVVKEIKEEKYQYLDIPLLIGYKFGPLRLMAGPEGHVYLDNTSGLFDFDGYGQDFENLAIGFLVGGGLDIWNLMIDFRYEGNFNKFGDHIVFDGKKYEFSDNASRFIFSVGLLF